jgi:hypothetical protein
MDKLQETHLAPGRLPRSGSTVSTLPIERDVDKFSQTAASDLKLGGTKGRKNEHESPTKNKTLERLLLADQRIDANDFKPPSSLLEPKSAAAKVGQAAAGRTRLDAKRISGGSASSPFKQGDTPSAKQAPYEAEFGANGGARRRSKRNLSNGSTGHDVSVSDSVAGASVADTASSPQTTKYVSFMVLQH